MALRWRKPTAAQAWAAVRKQTGSIIGPDGANWTAPANGGDAFQAWLKRHCADSAADIATDLQNAADTAAQMAERNAIPTTDPKCHSKPLIKIDSGCNVTVEWHARTRNESDCGM